MDELKAWQKKYDASDSDMKRIGCAVRLFDGKVTAVRTEQQQLDFDKQEHDAGIRFMLAGDNLPTRRRGL